MFHLRTETPLDKAFATGIALKAMDAVIEVIGGLWLLFVSPEQLQKWAGVLFAPGLNEDPGAFIATHVMRWTSHFQHGTVIFAAAYLLSHGIAKLVVVVEILRGRSWAYPGLIILTGLFVLYQVYHMAMTGLSLGYLLLTAFDVLIIALTVVEYSRLRSHMS